MAEMGPNKTPDSVVIAKIYPINPAARQALDRMIDSDHVSDYHQSFMFEDSPPEDSELSESDRAVAPREEPNDIWVVPSGMYLNISLDVAVSDAGRLAERDPQLWAGHYRLDLDNLPSSGEALSWRAGKGNTRLKNQGIELLFVPPKSTNHRYVLLKALQ